MYTEEVDALAKEYVSQIPISVLLIDDEFLIGEAMRTRCKQDSWRHDSWIVRV